MNAPERIVVFYSIGQEYDQILKSIRAHYPAAHITALVPSAYLDTDAIAPLVDEVQRTNYESYPVRHPMRIVDLVKSLRNERIDLFVVIFDSVKLRFLSSLTKAPRCCAWALHGRVVPLETNPLHTAFDVARQIPLGWWRYWRVWLNVHLARAGRTR